MPESFVPSIVIEMSKVLVAPLPAGIVTVDGADTEMAPEAASPAYRNPGVTEKVWRLPSMFFTVTVRVSVTVSSATST